MVMHLIELLSLLLLAVPIHEVGHNHDQLDGQGPHQHHAAYTGHLRAAHLALLLLATLLGVTILHVHLHPVDTVSDQIC